MNTIAIVKDTKSGAEAGAKRSATTAIRPSEVPEERKSAEGLGPKSVVGARKAADREATAKDMPAA
jgi:hypothetical protein